MMYYRSTFARGDDTDGRSVDVSQYIEMIMNDSSEDDLERLPQEAPRLMNLAQSKCLTADLCIVIAYFDKHW